MRRLWVLLVVYAVAGVAMVAAHDMCGERGRCVKAMPHARLTALLKRFGRYQPPR